MCYAALMVYVEPDETPEGRVRLAAGLADKFSICLNPFRREYFRSECPITGAVLRDSQGADEPRCVNCHLAAIAPPRAMTCILISHRFGVPLVCVRPVTLIVTTLSWSVPHTKAFLDIPDGTSRPSRWRGKEKRSAQQLRGAPAFSRERSYDWSDRNRERELHDYHGVPPYWGA
jgi:hypothetical protein